MATKAIAISSEKALRLKTCSRWSRFGEPGTARHRRERMDMKRVRVAAFLLLAGAATSTYVLAAAAQAAELPFTSDAAEAVLRPEILTRFPSATFPATEGRLCPETYMGAEGAYSICYAEFRSGNIWHLEGGRAALKENHISVALYTRAHWRRTWVKCALSHGAHGAPGTLASNYNCGLHQVSDAYLVTVEIYPSTRMHEPLTGAGWEFTESAGFTSLGDFHVRKQGRTYSFTNAVGDSFRYTP